MRRIFPYVAMLLAFASCTKDYKTDYDPDMELHFQPVMYVASKADISEDYPAGQSFAITAWTADKTNIWQDSQAELEMYLDNETVVFNQDTWNPLSGMLWPSRTLNLNVIGYTPVDAFVACTYSEGAKCSYDMTQTQEDLLYTDPQINLDKVKCGGVITIPFRHALSQVDFEVKNRVSKNEEIIIKSIKIDNVQPLGHFCSLPEPQWTVGGDPVTLTFFEGEQMTHNFPEQIGRTWNIIPQTLSTKVSVEYEYKTAANTGFTTTVKTCELQTNLKPGRHYTYTLSVGIDDVKFLLEIIEERFR